MNLLACGLTSIRPCPTPLNTPSISFFHSSDIHVQFTLKHDYFSVHEVMIHTRWASQRVT